jgi:predicted permease
VRAASLTSILPGVDADNGQFAVEGAAYATDRDYPSANSFVVTPGFLETFQIPLREGRAFTTQDREDGAPVAIVNERFVRDIFKGADPIGRRIRLGGARSTAPWMQIVGVASDTYSGDPDRLRQPTIYLPLAQHPTNFLSIAVRGIGAPMSLTPAVRDVVSSLNADIPLYWVYSMDEALARPTWFFRVFGTIFIIFGGVALFLASIGLYAVMAFSVSRRSKEIGIRAALGAQRDHVIRMILRQGFVQLVIGMLAGLALAAAVAQALRLILFDVQPRDPIIFGLVVVVLSATTLAACIVPALRATRVDPLIVLRGE